MVTLSGSLDKIIKDIQNDPNHTMNKAFSGKFKKTNDIMKIISLIHQPELKDGGRVGAMKPAGWTPSHMAIIDEESGIIVCCPQGRSQFKTRDALEEAAELIKEKLFNNGKQS